jgi:hypothetical protein
LKYFVPRTKIHFSRKYFLPSAIALGSKYLGENIFLKQIKKIWGKIKNEILGQNNLGENIQHRFLSQSVSTRLLYEFPTDFNLSSHKLVDFFHYFLVENV